MPQILVEKKILLVEDEELVCEMYKKFFEGNGVTVVVAPDGKTALNILEHDTFDVVVLDRMLSVDMDGFEVLRHMREMEKTKNTPVVILTNLNLEDSEIEFVTTHNVAGYHVKADISLDALSDVIEALFRDN